MPVRAVACFVAVLALAACSGGDAGSNGQPSGPTTPGGATTATAGPAPAGTAGTATPGGDYCGYARLYAKAFERFGQPGTPAEIRAYYRDAAAGIQQAIPTAPAEIRADLQVVSEMLQTLMTALDGIGYDFSRVGSLSPGLIARLMSQQFVQASTRVATYSRDRCAIS